jgi:hypothetical protein
MVSVAAGCGDNLAPVPTAPLGPRGQGSEPTGDLVLNEIAPRGDGADWIEIVHRGAAPIDLCAVFLTDAVDRLDHYLPLGGVLPPEPCVPRWFAPGAYLRVQADDTAVPEGGAFDPAHAPFELGVADEVHLVTIDGTVLDGLTYLYPPGPLEPADVTLARVPDGRGVFFAALPTPDAPNPPEVP